MIVYAETKIIAALVVILALVGGGFYMRHHWITQGYASKTSEVTRADAAAAVVARKHEADQKSAFDRIGNQYGRDLADAQTTYDHNLAALRSGFIRLRKPWNCPSLPSASASTGQPDGQADERNQSAARIIANADAADAQINGLQAVLSAERP